MADIIYRGQGKIYLASRDANGNRLAMRYIGLTNNGAKIGLATSSEEIKESDSGQALTVFRGVTEKKATIEFDIMQWDSENLALGLWGVSATVASGSVTGEVMPSGLVADDLYFTNRMKISTVVVKDSAGSPATLATPANYLVENADSGRIKIINPASFTQPFKVDYAYAAQKNVAMFGTNPGEKWLVFEGLNVLDGNEPVMVELYRCSLDPLAELVLKSDTYTPFKVVGSALYDGTKANDSTLGVFGRVRTLK